MQERFEGVAGRTRLLELLLGQQLVQGDAGLAAGLAERGELVFPGEGAAVLRQDGADSDVFFVLAGEVWIVVNRQRLYPRGAGVTVGEIAAVNPALPRTASVEAGAGAELLRVSAEAFDALGSEHPAMWKRLAANLGSRLQQRNSFVRRSNDTPRIFVISSAEALPIAEALRACMAHDRVLVTIWGDEVFRPSQYPLEALELQLEEADFAIAIAQADDLVHRRGETRPVPRDNVLVELGLFIGALGRRRTLLLAPAGEDLELPSDFKGLTPVAYRTGPRKDLAALLGPTCEAIRTVVEEQGLRT